MFNDTGKVGFLKKNNQYVLQHRLDVVTHSSIATQTLTLNITVNTSLNLTLTLNPDSLPDPNLNSNPIADNERNETHSILDSILE